MRAVQAIRLNSSLSKMYSDISSDISKQDRRHRGLEMIKLATRGSLNVKEAICEIGRVIRKTKTDTNGGIV